MFKTMETALIWACLPFVAILALAAILNMTWGWFAIIVLVILSPIIGGFAYGCFLAGRDWRRDVLKERERERQLRQSQTLLAQQPDEADDVAQVEIAVMPSTVPKTVVPPRKQLPSSLGNQWRATIK